MYIKKCPQCNEEQTYCNKQALKSAINKNSNCKKCASKKSGFIERYATLGKNTGIDNAFFGKSHTEEYKKNSSIFHTGKTHSVETKKKLSELTSGENNPMYGRKFFDIWTEKYGMEKANLLHENKKKKNSIASSGKNNPMYGKPTPNGSGNGWKGWFKGIFFRSLRELTFLTVIFDEDWSTGETLVIPYSEGRTYRPDFIIGDEVIEIKPQKLHNTPNVMAKAKAAKKYCKKMGKTYKIIDPGMLPLQDMVKLVNSGDVVFQERYNVKFEEYKKKHGEK